MELDISPSPPPYPSFWTAFRFWLRLGCISFGGPAGQIAIMHQELVEKRRWISEKRFLHALNYCMVLPGPEAQQLATYIGWLLHGTRGGLAAGILFVLPSLFLLLILSWIYVAFGSLPWIIGVFDGMKPAVVAVVGWAVFRLGRRALGTVAQVGVAACAFVGLFFFHLPYPLILLGAGLVSLAGSRFRKDWFQVQSGQAVGKPVSAGPTVLDDDHDILAHSVPGRARFAWQLFLGIIFGAVPFSGLIAWQGWAGPLPQMALFFTQAALLTFGGAYAVLPYIQHHAVSVFGWLQPGQMIDGLALGETTPGPLIMVVTFVGFVGGWQVAELGWAGGLAGGLIATYFTFLPSFLFIFLGGPFIEQRRGELRLHTVLSGITAAVVGVILNLAVVLGEKVLWTGEGNLDGFAVILMISAFGLLFSGRLGIIPVILGSGLAGFIHSWLAA